MRTVLMPLLYTLADAFRSQAALPLENLAFRPQLVVFHHSGCKCPHLRLVDRLFWACLSTPWPGCRNPLMIVKPDTVTGWLRKGFRLSWACKSRRDGGRSACRV